jgi:hypothetical protein
MKKCIVLSGQYRTFDQTWEKIKQFIDNNQLDVYCHLWSTNVNEVNSIVDKLKPIKYLVEDPSRYVGQFQAIERNVLLKNPKPLSTDKIAGNASMNYSRKKAFELIEDEYESLVYCRYDIRFRNIFQFEDVDVTVTPLEESYNLISDIFAIMPFKDAKHYFIYDQYERLHSTPFEPEFVEWLKNVKKYPEQDIKIHIEQRYCPHMMLMRNLIMNNITFISENIPLYLQR